MNYQLAKDGVILIPDEGKRRFIPADPANHDWQGYQRWLIDGNTPLPDESAVQERAYQDKLATLEAEILDNLPSWQQVSDQIDSIYPPGPERIYQKKLARIVYLMARRELI